MYKKLALIGLLAIAGCKTTEEVKPSVTSGAQNVFEGAPTWVLKSSGAFTGDRGKGFYGVGSASKIMNVSLWRNAASAQARAEIAKTMSAYVANLQKQYQESASNGDPNVMPQEVQFVQNTLKEFASETLHGVQVIDFWISKDGSTMFALAHLDFNEFKEDMNKVKTLNDRAREAIKARADQGFADLDKEEAKKAAQQ